MGQKWEKKEEEVENGPYFIEGFRIGNRSNRKQKRLIITFPIIASGVWGKGVRRGGECAGGRRQGEKRNSFALLNPIFGMIPLLSFVGNTDIGTGRNEQDEQEEEEEEAVQRRDVRRRRLRYFLALCETGAIHI